MKCIVYLTPYQRLQRVDRCGYMTLPQCLATTRSVQFLDHFWQTLSASGRTRGTYYSLPSAASALSNNSQSPSHQCLLILILQFRICIWSSSDVRPRHVDPQTHSSLRDAEKVSNIGNWQTDRGSGRDKVLNGVRERTDICQEPSISLASSFAKLKPLAQHSDAIPVGQNPKKPPSAYNARTAQCRAC